MIEITFKRSRTSPIEFKLTFSSISFKKEWIEFIPNDSTTPFTIPFYLVVTIRELKA